MDQLSKLCYITEVNRVGGPHDIIVKLQSFTVSKSEK